MNIFNKKESKEKKKYVRICPQCESLDVCQETPGVSLNIAFGMPTMYKCKKCGFQGYIFPEVEIQEKCDDKVKCKK
jgi:hypothetical protein